MRGKDIKVVKIDKNTILEADIINSINYKNAMKLFSEIRVSVESLQYFNKEDFVRYSNKAIREYQTQRLIKMFENKGHQAFNKSGFNKVNYINFIKAIYGKKNCEVWDKTIINFFRKNPKRVEPIIENTISDALEVLDIHEQYILRRKYCLGPSITKGPKSFSIIGIQHWLKNRTKQLVQYRHKTLIKKLRYPTRRNELDHIFNILYHEHNILLEHKK